MTGRRGLATAVVGVAAGAGLLLFSASRVWWTEVVEQPPPLSAQEVAHTGGSLAPSLPALALVALAGAGGLLATRGGARRLVGALVTVAAVASFVLTAVVLARPEVGAVWPVGCLVGALVAGAGGAWAVRDGARWPVMGARYSRTRSHTGDSRTRDSGARDDHAHRAGAGEDGTAGPQPVVQSSVDIWDALDRGEDPTRE